MEEQEKKEEKKKDIQKDTLQPITKVNSKLGKLIQLPVVGEEKTLCLTKCITQIRTYCASIPHSLAYARARAVVLCLLIL